MHRLPSPALHLFRRGAGVLVPPAVVPENVPVRLGHPGKLRDGVGHRSEPLLALAQRLLGLFDLFDIGASAEPFLNLAVRTAYGRAVDQPPAIDAIGAPQTAFQQVGFVVLRRTLPGIPGALLVIGVEGSDPAMAVTFIQRQPGVIHPLLIEIDVPTIGPGGPNDLRHGLREGAKLLLALAQGLLGPLLLGDVATGHHRPDNRAVLIPNGSKAVTSNPRFSHVFASQCVLGIRGCLTAKHPGDRPLIERCQLAVGHKHVQDVRIFGEGLEAFLLVPEPMIGGEGIIEVDEPALNIGDEDRIGHAGQCRLQLRPALYDPAIPRGHVPGRQVPAGYPVGHHRPKARRRGPPCILKSPGADRIYLRRRPGVGKTAAAEALAADLGCAGDFGGLTEIPSGTQDGKAVESVLRSLRLTPMGGSGWKVVIINEADRMTEQAEAIWLDGLEHLPAKSVVIFTTNNLSRMTPRLIRRCEVYQFDSTSETFRAEMARFIRMVWERETGRPLGTIPEGLGRFELGSDDYSIGLALQQIAPYVRTGEPLPASFAPPIIRGAYGHGKATPATPKAIPNPLPGKSTPPRDDATALPHRSFCRVCRQWAKKGSVMRPTSDGGWKHATC